MRESNFAFPTQNKACVCITSQLYDRRALDTSSPLPLLNSLTHLTYLTSTSPRIREIMTMDGGLERLVRILHDFCICPPPPDNGAVLYGLIPPSVHPPRPLPTLNPPAFDKQAAYRFSLAFQCVVNIGVRGSEPIRSRVVQAGTLDVVGCILEAWLANKGFAVGPSASATGLPRETREQRQARRDAHLAQRQREQAAELDRQRNRQPVQQRGPRPPTLRLPGQFEEDESMDISSAADTSSTSLHDALLLLSASTHRASTSTSASTSAATTPGSDTEMSTDASTAATPVGSGTPTGSVIVPAPVRDRSGTVIARPSWDPPLPSQRSRGRERRGGSGGESPVYAYNTDESSRPETETEDEVDADGDVDMERAGASGSGTARQRRRGTVVASSSHSHVQPQASGSGSGSGSGSSGAHLQAHVYTQDSDTASPSPERRPSLSHTHGHGHRRLSLTHPHPHARRAVGIVSDDQAADTDAHIIINDSVSGVGVGGVGVGGVVGGGVEDGIVSLEANDDFAMGAPPGAPGAIAVAVVGAGEGLGLGLGEGEGESEGEVGVEMEVERRAERERERRGVAPDETPRPGMVGLPSVGPAILGGNGGSSGGGMSRVEAAPPRPAAPGPHSQSQAALGQAQGQGQTDTPRPAGAGAGAGGGPGQAARGQTQTQAPGQTAQPPPPPSHTHAHGHRHRHHHHAHEPQGPYRDEDVLLSLQLLAYLSKYPHVRQAFYKPRVTFHPASVDVVGGRWGREREGVVTPAAAGGVGGRAGRAGKEREKEGGAGKEAGTGSGAAGFFRSLGVGARVPKAAAQEKDAAQANGNATGKEQPPAQKRQTNVFSLVERFTFKPSSTETDLPNPPPRLPPEIQYWAGVVMRNACRKDESRGGIRQCANMLCGRWEAYPRQFAKCRRCRKAKYCGKECQSIAWSEGHRFWCSAKDDDDATAAAATAAESAAGGNAAGGSGTDAAQARRERRERDRERARERMAATAAAAAGGLGTTTTVMGEGLRGPGMGGGIAPATSRTAAVPPVRTEAWPDPRHGIPRINTRTHHSFVLSPQQHSQQQQQQSPIGTRPARDMGGPSRLLQQQSPPPPPPPSSSSTGYAVTLEGLAEASVAGRRRAETVTGATVMGMGAIGPGVSVGVGVGVGPDGRMSAAHYPHGHGRLPPPRAFAVGAGAAANPLLQPQTSQYAVGYSPVRAEAGPSRRRRAQAQAQEGASPSSAVFRSPVEENDMILG
ncbi:hypothetical protein D9615_005833 [Tricholomella constricta]|uniref:MYND-type domain-containing protein n=1 Tax=Tricholomella constricta TaxID=117010 RepID=A0A8H5HAK7_9AGAR|nr:hypothetical protein D9615_005833 [Tricholomella constricta]